MKTIDALRINFKKLKIRPAKALFLIFPIIILLGLSIVISSQVNNFGIATDKSIFGEIAEEGKVLEVVYQTTVTDNKMQFLAEENMFTELDLETIKNIDSISEASINYSIPISNITVNNLFEEQEFDLKHIFALNESMATLYTTENFTYTQGEPIPIILNASTFLESYDDWEGNNELTVNFKAMRESGEDISQGTPTKTKAISYDKESLVGNEFTITFGGFRDIPPHTIEKEMGVITFKKLSDEEIATSENTRNTTISQYWDYETLSKGLTYTFKVVSIVETENSNSTYIPEGFVKVLMSNYIELEQNATLGSVPIDKLGTTFTGLMYDGIELNKTTLGMKMGGIGGGGGIGGSPTSTTDNSYEIPGLVIETEEDGITVIDKHADSNVFDNALKSGTIITVKLDSFYNRQKVVASLNAAGYAYQDVNKLGVFDEIKSMLGKISVWLIIGFVGLSISVIILTMSKFVSDSTKEIGIFRAVGFKKKDILVLFLSQSLLYTTIGYIGGIGVGLLSNYLVSPIIAKWFDNLVTKTVKESFNVVNSVDYSIFNSVDWASVQLFSIVLIVITVVISFIPAIKASQVSPVEAIKNE